MSDDKIRKLERLARQGDEEAGRALARLLCRREGHSFNVLQDVPQTTDMVLQCEICEDWFPARYIIYMGGEYGRRWYQIIDTVKGEVTHTFGDASSVLRKALELNNEAQFELD
jgi:hypothetical protein